MEMEMEMEKSSMVNSHSAGVTELPRDDRGSQEYARVTPPSKPLQADTGYPKDGNAVVRAISRFRNIEV